jgi:hypothetical protein
MLLLKKKLTAGKREKKLRTVSLMLLFNSFLCGYRWLNRMKNVEVSDTLAAFGTSCHALPN